AAAVCGFEVEIDGKRKVKGIVKVAKQAAKELFRITYLTELKHNAETESIRLVFPTAIEYTSANNRKKLILDVVIESLSHHISSELNIDSNPNASKIILVELFTYLKKDLILVVKSSYHLVESVSHAGQNQILEDTLLIETNSDDKPTLSFFRDKATLTSYSNYLYGYENSTSTPCCLLKKGFEPSLQGTKIHTLAARKFIQDLEEGTSFIQKNPRNKGKNISDSPIHEQIVKRT
ncbi:31567_t:CDS:2, partial [Gigaspora margarita]